MKNEFKNWSDIRVFLAVAREGSTLAASRKLGISQPTVARRIEALENEIGLTLFERDTRGFRVTEDARRLIPPAEAIEKHTENFARKTHELAKQRPIRITAPGGFSDRVTSIFSEFAATHPGIAFEFVHSMKFLNLLGGEADIAFRVGESDPDEKLVCRKIGTEHLTIYGSQQYADKFGLPKSRGDLAGHHFVTLEHGEAQGSAYDWFKLHVSPDQIIMSFSEFELMLASIRAGQGLGLVHTRFADKDEALIRCFDDIEEISRTMMMLIAPEAYRRPEVKAFVKFFAPRYAALFKRGKKAGK